MIVNPDERQDKKGNSNFIGDETNVDYVNDIYCVYSNDCVSLVMHHVGLPTILVRYNKFLSYFNLQA